MGTMNARRGSSTQLAFAGLCVTVFTIALAALVTSQLALMSVLDPASAERAAEQIATSRFTADVIEQTVQRAVSPIAGDDIASQLATATSANPRVTGVVSSSLMAVHRQIVDAESDPATSASPADGNLAIQTAIAQSIFDTAIAAGVDPASFGIDLTDVASLPLDAAAQQEGLASLVPTDVPSLGLRLVAETTRVIAAIVMVAFGLVAVLAHPRSGRGLRRLGITITTMCGVWLVGLLLTGWIIGLVADTLFGEMLRTVWNDAVASMLLLLGAGAVLGFGITVAGMAADGWSRERQQRRGA
jgi:hypothetical protein